MTVHSDDRRTWLTKLDRIGELSTQDHGMVFNNVGHLINVDMLREMYHRLDGSKATGIDGITKRKYGEDLEENLQQLARSIHKGQYCPKPSRIVEIPKPDGGTRPLAISCIEDKLVQMAANEILSSIYEPLFLPCSFGYRPGKSCHDALRALNQAVFKSIDGAVLEIDIRKYFNTIPHKEMEEILLNKISDKHFLRLIHKLLQARTITANGEIEENLLGCPQGSILSPILSNIYLHVVLDKWVEMIKPYLRGRIDLIRYCDDMIFVFEYMEDAKRCYQTLGKRMGRYGLAINEDKSALHPSGSGRIARMNSLGKKLPMFKFLGFLCYWGEATTKRFWRLKMRSRRDRKAAKLKGLREFLKKKNMKTSEMFRHVIAIVRGWINYHAINDNQNAVKGFIYHCQRIIFKWMNRKGGKRKISWKKFADLLKRVRFPSYQRTISIIGTSI
jgi:RNA-directed DNA polymerase